MNGKRYQSGYDDGFEAGNWAGQRDVLLLVRELRDMLAFYTRGKHAELLARADKLFAEAREGKEESRE